MTGFHNLEDLETRIKESFKLQETPGVETSDNKTSS